MGFACFEDSGLYHVAKGLDSVERVGEAFCMWGGHVYAGNIDVFYVKQWHGCRSTRVSNDTEWRDV